MQSNLNACGPRDVFLVEPSAPSAGCPAAFGIASKRIRRAACIGSARWTCVYRGWRAAPLESLSRYDADPFAASVTRSTGHVVEIDNGSTTRRRCAAICRTSRPRLEHQVEWRLRRTTKTGEAALHHDVAQPLHSRPRAEPGGDFLRARGGSANERRRRVEDPSDRIQVAFQPVVGIGLDDEPRSSRSSDLRTCADAPTGPAETARRREIAD
jgi:hypothetical protein